VNVGSVAGEVVLRRGPIPREIMGFRFPTEPYREPTVALFDGALPGGSLALVIRDPMATFPRMIVLPTNSSHEISEATMTLLCVDEGMFDSPVRRVLRIDRFGCVQDFDRDDVVWEIEFRRELASLENDWKDYRIVCKYDVPELGRVRVLKRKLHLWSRPATRR